MHASALPIPSGPDTLDAQWLTRALRARGVLKQAAVRALRCERFGEGIGMFGCLARIHVEYDQPEPGAPTSLVAKFPAGADMNRTTAHMLDFYGREIRFYAHVPDCPVPTPRVLYADIDDANRFILLMEEVQQARMADQIQGTTVDQSLIAIRTIAKLHARYWGKVDDLDWLMDRTAPAYMQLIQHVYGISLERTLEACAQVFTPETADVARRLAQALPDVMGHFGKAPRTISHGDYRADNLLFGTTPDAPELTVVDWQLVAKARGVYDVGYHMSQSAPPAVRRAVERQAIEAYHQVLTEHGVTGYSLDDAWYDYRMAVLFCLVYPVTVTARLDLSHERSRALAATFLERALSAIEDVGAAELLPASGQGDVAAVG